MLLGHKRFVASVYEQGSLLELQYASDVRGIEGGQKSGQATNIHRTDDRMKPN